MKKLALIISLILCLCLSGCSSAPKVKNTYFALDTIITTEIHGENAALLDGQIFSDINTLGAVLDAKNLPTDVISADSAHVYQLLGAALSISKLTGGAFDVSVGGFVDAWGFSDKSYRVPTADELAQIQKSVGYEKIEGTELGYYLPEGCKITFGAIAKGYISDIIYKRLESEGAEKAIISLGGNIIAFGSNGDEPWKVGVENPEGNGGYVAVLGLSDCFAVTSGGYHRNFTKDGVTYHHIIDPATGYPAESDLRSVTIVGKSGTLADALSTALFVMGSEKATEFWQKSSLEFDFMLLTTSGEMIVSSPLAERLTDADITYTLRVAKK